jgi:hypothetical protein
MKNQFFLHILLVISILNTSFAQENPQGTYKGKSNRDGLPHGNGKYVWADGSNYSGNFSNGKMDGWGAYIGADGSSYNGDWNMGKKEGYGNFRWKNGDSYSGYFQGDKRSGKGVFVSVLGERYDGYWKNDFAEGKGEYLWANGTKYIGEWKEGKMNGQGILLYADGNVEQGTFENGKYISCKCNRETLTVEDAYKEADAVFYGKITSINTSQGYDAVEFQVERHWKGKLYPQRRIYLRAEYTSCDHIFYEGGYYLVYAKVFGNDVFKADKCSRTVEKEFLQNDLETLSKMPCIEQNVSNTVQSYSVEEDTVCGCNGQNYKNAYEAEKAGVKYWKSGWCEKK